MHIVQDITTSRERDEQEVKTFLSKVRLPGSGAVASVFSRIDALIAARTQRLADEYFKRSSSQAA